MPNLDGTGPQGQGPGTGRGYGPCAGGRDVRRGWGCCGGFDFGLRRRISPKDQLAALEEEEKILSEELTAVREEKKSLQDQSK